MAISAQLRSIGSQVSENISNLGKDVEEISEIALLMDYYSRVIKNQELPDVSQFPAMELPRLGPLYRTAKANGNFYRSVVKKEMIASVTQIEEYSTAFLDSIDPIMGALDAYERGSTTARSDALSMMFRLQADLSEQREKTVSVSGRIGDLVGRLAADASGFEDAQETLSQLFKTNAQELRDLERGISRIEDGIMANNRTATRSALVAVGGFFLLVLGTLLTGGLGAPAAVAGGAVLVGGTAVSGVTSTIAAGLTQDKQDLLDRKKTLMSAQKAVTAIRSDLKTFSGAADGAVRAVNAMTNSWGLIGGDLQIVTQAIENAQTAEELIVIRVSLESARENWSTVQESAATLSSQLGKTEIRSVGELDAETIKALQSQVDSLALAA